jgi:hypothetical protein
VPDVPPHVAKDTEFGQITPAKVTSAKISAHAVAAIENRGLPNSPIPL